MQSQASPRSHPRPGTVVLTLDCALRPGTVVHERKCALRPGTVVHIAGDSLVDPRVVDIGFVSCRVAPLPKHLPTDRTPEVCGSDTRAAWHIGIARGNRPTRGQSSAVAATSLSRVAATCSLLGRCVLGARGTVVLSDPGAASRRGALPAARAGTGSESSTSGVTSASS